MKSPTKRLRYMQNNEKNKELNLKDDGKVILYYCSQYNLNSFLFMAMRHVFQPMRIIQLYLSSWTSTY